MRIVLTRTIAVLGTIIQGTGSYCVKMIRLVTYQLLLETLARLYQSRDIGRKKNKEEKGRKKTDKGYSARKFTKSIMFSIYLR